MRPLHAHILRGYAWWEHQLTGMHDAHPVIAASGISPRLWRLYAQAWLVCLLFPIVALMQQPPAMPVLLLALAGLTSFVIAYTVVMWSHPLHTSAPSRWSFHAPLVLLTGLVTLVLLLSWVAGSAFLWLFVGVSAIVGVLLPARSAFAMVMALTLLTLGWSVVLAGSIGAVDWLHIIPLVLLVRGLGLDMAGMSRLATALRELHTTRGELARMVVVEERLRVARDLHDLLGHTLAMITLKSELAARLVSHNGQRASQEMREVEQAARQTLREVRLAVANYRQPTLLSELDGARQLLEAAGVDCIIESELEQIDGTVPAAVSAALAWTVREGVTNVIRHGHPHWCRIRIARGLGTLGAEVTNDGVCSQAPSDALADAGSGLTGLTERVIALGGQLVAGSVLVAHQPAFQLSVELPIESDDQRQAERRS
jgi:two-component system sensor histidine kinase DesK